MKKLWLVFPALLIAGIVMMGCPDGTTVTVTTPTPTEITWAATANGSVTESTSIITITFTGAVNVRAQDISLGTAPIVTRGALTGAGTVWMLAVSNPTTTGTVSVTVSGIANVETGTQDVTVYKEGVALPTMYTAVADGASGTTTSTKITFSFTKNGVAESVSGLTANEITISAGTNPVGAATKGTLTATSNTSVWELTISNVTQGNIVVKITKDGIDSGNKTVAVYKQEVTEEDFDFTDITVTDMCVHEAQTAAHKGWIEIEDFLTIKYSKADSLLRLTFKIRSTADGSWGAFGKIGDSDNGLDLTIPSTTTTGATVTLDFTVAQLLTNVGPDAIGIFVNAWNCDPSVELVVQLVETKTGTRPTNPGYSTVTFALDGGSYTTPLAPLDVENGKALGTRFPANPLKTGYRCTGWKDASGTDFTSTTVVSADVTVTAQWEVGEPENYTVTFTFDGGIPASSIGTISVVEGQSLGAQFPSTPIRKEGQWFDGWKDASGTAFTSSTPVTGDITVTAQWTPNTQPAITGEFTLSGYVFDTRIYNDWDKVERSTGKGAIAGVDFETLKAAAEDSVLALYIYNVGPQNPSSWNSAGALETLEKESEETRKEFGSGSITQGQTKLISAGTIKSILDWIGTDPSTYINLNIWGDTIILKIEIWKVDDNFVPPPEYIVNLAEDASGWGWSYSDGGLINDGNNAKFRYKNDAAQFAITLPANFDISNYSHFSIDGVAYDSEMEVTEGGNYGWGLASIKICSDVSADSNYGWNAIIASRDNLGKNGSGNTLEQEIEFTVTPGGIIVQKADGTTKPDESDSDPASGSEEDGSVCFIKITQIKFYMEED